MSGAPIHSGAMNGALMVLAVAALIVVAWLARRGAPGVGAHSRGACVALVLGIGAAALYSLGEERGDRLADFLGISLPLLLLVHATTRAMWTEGEPGQLRGPAMAAMGAGVILMLVAVAGRLSLVDAQILLASGAVLLLVADRGRHIADASWRPIVLVMGAVIAGGVWGALLTGGLYPVRMVLAILLIFAGIGGRAERGVDAFGQGAAGIVTAMVVSLGGGAVGAVALRAAENYRLFHPAGFMEHFEVMAQSVASARPMIGLGRFAPEALVLIACAGAALLLRPGTAGARWAAVVVLLGGVAVAADRMVAALGFAPFVF